MDVSGYNLESKMKLPDPCFGQKQVVSCYAVNNGVGTYRWSISSLALPDPVCIWHAMFCSQPSTGGTGRMRIGLAAAVPTTIAEMNAADEIFPDLGAPTAGPNYIDFFSTVYSYYAFDVRKGMATGGKKLVMSTYCVAATMRLLCVLVVSELPTKVPGWPGAWQAG